MNGLTLVDALFARLNATAIPRDVATIELIGSWMEEIVDSLVRDVNLLRRIGDECGTGDRAFDRVTFELLYAEFERWAHQADGVRKRIARLKKYGRQVANADELDDRYGLTMARLQVTFDGLDEADAQFRRGEGRTIEEVRNELRAAARAKGAGGVGATGTVASGGSAGRDRAAG